MKKFYALSLFLTWFHFQTYAQVDLSYYLPDSVTYNPAVPTPKSVIGHEVGEWHISHDRLVNYMYALDKASDRISLEATGYTHEARLLLLLTITSQKNHQSIETIRTQHIQLTDPAKSTSFDVATFCRACCEGAWTGRKERYISTAGPMLILSGSEERNNHRVQFLRPRLI